MASENAPDLPAAPRRDRINPLALRELDARMRGGHAAGLLGVLIFVTSGVSLLVYAVAALVSANQGAGASRTVGTGVFYALVGMQLIVAAFAAPALTCGAITGERERKTFDLLRSTALTPWQILLSKLSASLGFSLLILLATLPLFSLAFLLGGIELSQMGMALCLSIATAILFSVLGLCASCYASSTVSAVVVTYGAILLLLIGSGILLLALSGFLLPLTAGTAAGGRAATPSESALAQVATLGLMSLSPISAFVSSMLNFDNRNDMLRFSFNPAGPASGPLWPAPFAVLAALYLLAAIVLLFLAARRLGRIDP